MCSAAWSKGRRSRTPMPRSEPTYTVQHRIGLGPRVDPTYDSEVGRALADLEAAGSGDSAGLAGESRTSRTSGYIELFSANVPAIGRPLSAFEQLEALLAVTYGLPERAFRAFGLRGSIERPHVWTQITGLRYLTTDSATGVALPLILSILPPNLPS